MSLLRRIRSKTRAALAFFLSAGRVITSSAKVLFDRPKQWAGKHKGQQAIFVIALVGCVGISSYLIQFFRLDTHDLYEGVYFYPQKDSANLVKIVSKLQKGTGRRDTCSLNLYFASGATGWLRIVLPDDSSESTSNDFSSGISFVDSGEQSKGRHYFEYQVERVPRGAAIFAKEYYCSVFSKGAPEERLNVYIDPLKTSQPDAPIAELWLTHISDISVRSIEPMPDVQYEDLIEYTLVPRPLSETGRTWSEVRLVLNDRDAQERRELVIFVGGILLGTFLSLLVVVFLNFVTFLESG